MWNIFKETGNIGSYIVYKEITKKEESSYSNIPVVSVGKIKE